ncbi:hypothetical protein BDV23DRAFT_169262 [Aspergillus alliaceus]|uniref:Tryptophan synthase beta chain-like PALP domain-containing protein n=1 Tax=Petromyces alliaceus TaxID=209559 RepID=A0A5N7CL19_PETAA|nr:hypothetical protein BDV23DRAFT_169262 [Aspergillus alliaceus]
MSLNRAELLRLLPNFARQMDISKLFLKDESEWFGTSLASFKALGAPYAIYKLLVDEIFSQIGVLPTSCELRTDKYRYITQSVTGFSYGAKIFGCRFIDYIHNHVSVGRASWMKGLGLAVIHANGKYEASVERAKADARMNGWHFVSSTSWSDFDSGIPQDVMNAYVAVVEEALNRLPAVNEITHVSSAAVLEALLQQFSLVTKQNLRTACRTPSPAAWKILSWLTRDFSCRVRLGGSRRNEAIFKRDIPVVCGESSAATMGIMLLASRGSRLREKLSLNMDSQVVLFGLEGATDPDIYEQLVGVSSQAVFEAQSHFTRGHSV